MFEIRLFVEDKKLDKAMWALDGIAAEPPQIIPVRGAKVKKAANGATRVAAVHSPQSGRLQDRVRNLIHNSGKSMVTSKEMIQFTKEAGGAGSSASMINTLLIKEGVLTRINQGEYTVHIEN